MKVAVIGCGGIANAHLQCVELAGDQLVATVDINEKSAADAARKYGGVATSTVEDMLSKVVPDAAVVATPPNVHRSICTALLRAGVPVLCEKPLAHTLEDAEALADVARNAGVPAHVAYCHRFTPASQVMRDHVREGKLGKVLYFRNSFTGHVTLFDGSWRMDRAVSGGGSLMDTASHSIDLFHFIVGEIADVKASMYFPEEGKGDLAGSMMAIGKTGVAGHIMFGWRNSKPECMYEVIGTDMSLSYDLTSSGASVQVHRPGAEVESLSLDGGCDVRFVEQYKAFRRSVQGENTILASFADALEVSRVCEACYANAASIQ